MKHRIHLALTLSIVAIGGMAPRPAAANPGLLHKHGARPVGVPTMLPGQSAAGGGPTVDPGPFPICDMPPPDGRGRGPEGGPQFWHRLHPGAIGGDPGAIDAGIVDSGMVMVDGPPAGIAWGGIDGGSVEGTGDRPVVLYALPPGGPAGERGGAGFVGQPMNASMATAASTAEGIGGGGKDLAGGLPNRAAGVRTDSLATIRHHGHGPASQAAGVAVSGNDASGSVVQAGGVADDAAGKAAHDRRSKLAAPVAAGQAAVPSGATSAPRWRDRLRFAWPTKP
jgi:hypothetical protein